MSALDAAWAPIGVVLAALITGAVTWFLARRKSSGTVRTSEAQDLWTANQEFRNMLLEEARARTNENKALREEAEKCHKEQAELARRLATVERELSQRSAGGS